LGTAVRKRDRLAYEQTYSTAVAKQVLLIFGLICNFVTVHESPARRRPQTIANCNPGFAPADNSNDIARNGTIAGRDYRSHTAAPVRMANRTNWNVEARSYISDDQAGIGQIQKFVQPFPKG
jgi:hypothetical protein